MHRWRGLPYDCSLCVIISIKTNWSRVSLPVQTSISPCFIKRSLPSLWQSSISNTNPRRASNPQVSPHPAKRTPSLTSNSWGISRRARYSLASLVFISSRISFRNHNLFGAFVSRFFRCLSAAWCSTGSPDPQRIFALCEDFTTGFLQAMPPRHPPFRWCGCVAHPSSLPQRSASSAHHVRPNVGTEVPRFAK